MALLGTIDAVCWLLIGLAVVGSGVAGLAVELSVDSPFNCGGIDKKSDRCWLLDSAYSKIR